MKRAISLVAGIIWIHLAFGQLKVSTSGKVGIGLGSMIPERKLHLLGEALFDAGDEEFGSCVIPRKLIFDGSVLHSGGPTGSALYPDGLVYLGKSRDNSFGRGYIDYIYYSTLYQYSDIRLKEDIKPVRGALDMVKRMQAIDYKYASGRLSSYQKSDENSTTRQYGFSAQEMEKICPRLVYYDTLNDVYSVNYIAVIPLLVEALKEQQAILEELCLQSGAKLKEGTVDTDVEKSAKEGNELFQNRPNPFSNSTLIEYRLAEGIRGAKIVVYNLQGLQLKSFPLQGTGAGTLTINANELPAGIYLYALLVDDREVDIKRMVISQ